MRSVDSWLDRFAYKHPKFAIPNLMLILVIGNAAVFLLDLFSSASFSALLSFAPYHILHGQIWRLVTFVFVPLSSSPIGVLFTLYFYYFIGTSLEREWGSAKFTLYYAVGVALNVVVGLLLFLPSYLSAFGQLEALGYAGEELSALIAANFSGYVTASTTYLNLSMFFAFATLYPDMQLLLFFLIPVKIKWLAWLDAAIFAWGVVSSLIALNWVGAVLPLVAILNYFLFFWSDLTASLRRTAQRARRQTSRQTVNFKKAARQAQEHKGYLHKCAVCGKTDTDFPDEEFRYCSQCNGYYCYCSAHIHDHVHIK